MSPRHRRIQTTLAVLALTVVLAACGAGTGSDRASSSGSGGSADLAEPAAPSRAGAAQDFAASKNGEAARPAADTVVNRSVIATGQLRLSSAHLADVRQDAVNLTTGLARLRRRRAVPLRRPRHAGPGRPHPPSAGRLLRAGPGPARRARHRPPAPAVRRGRHHPGDRQRRARARPEGERREHPPAPRPGDDDRRDHVDRGAADAASGRARLARAAAEVARRPDLDVHRPAHPGPPAQRRRRPTTPASSVGSRVVGTRSGGRLSLSAPPSAPYSRSRSCWRWSVLPPGPSSAGGGTPSRARPPQGPNAQTPRARGRSAA